MFASHWAVVLVAVNAHVSFAKQNQWTLPTMLPLTDANAQHSTTSTSTTAPTSTSALTNDPSSVTAAAGTAVGGALAGGEAGEATIATGDQRSLVLTSLTPYWLNRLTSTRNDVALHGSIHLLTAPNMSGKSTIMRAILTAALLANCGLFVPATHAIVPRFDNFFLRSASYDIPSEGKSAFALEMDDVRVMLRDCTHRSLVMLDEIGMRIISTYIYIYTYI